MSDVSGPTGPSPSNGVRQAIDDASRRTGVRFDFLLDQARRESGFQPEAKATTSSASGLYQFIDQTWLRLMHEHGPRHGLSAEANEISVDGGRFDVSTPAERQRILDLRMDAHINALMAGEYARENYDRLSTTLNRPIGETDLALAHFLGGEGATRFLSEMERAPATNAARLFPEAAQANKPVFYSQGAQPRSLAEVYRFFSSEGGGAMAGADQPWPGRGHFMSAVPAGGGGSLLSAPNLPSGSNLWRVLTMPSEN